MSKYSDRLIEKYPTVGDLKKRTKEFQEEEKLSKLICGKRRSK